MATSYYEPTRWSSKDGISREEFDALEKKLKIRNIELLDKLLYRSAVNQIIMICNRLGCLPENYSEKAGEITLDMLGRIEISEKYATRYPIGQIIENQQSGIYIAHQICDYNDEITIFYQKWFDNIARDSFLFTMPLKQILKLSDYDREGNETGELSKIFGLHNRNASEIEARELSEIFGLHNKNASEIEARELSEIFGLDKKSVSEIKIPSVLGYSIENFKMALEKCCEPYIILSLIAKNIHLEEFNNLPYVVGTTDKKNKIAISLSSKEVFLVYKNKLVLLDNSYEFMFKALRLPITTVLNTLLIDRDQSLLPSEGIYETNQVIRRKLMETIGTPKYDEAYRLTKFSSFDYF